jgi:hypothetical protein
MLDMANDSGLFRTAAQLEAEGWTLRGNVFHRDAERCVPLYEAKMTNIFDHRHGSVIGSEVLSELSGIPARGTTLPEHQDPFFSALPRYWVHWGGVEERLRPANWDRGFLPCFRDVARATDIRTAVHSILPRTGVGHKAPLILPAKASSVQIAGLLANLNSFVLDFVVRQKIGGASLSYFIVKQLAVLPPAVHDGSARWNRTETLSAWLQPRVLELVYTAWDLEAFARDVGWDGPPFRWDPDRRFLIRCELDAAFFHLYLGTAEEWRGQPESLTSTFPTPRDAVAYIMDTFPIVRRNDEAAHGEYRTKRVILEIFDQMAQATRAGGDYRTRVSPPPADPSSCHAAAKGTDVISDSDSPQRDESE